jgi:hypothetical protein
MVLQQMMPKPCLLLVVSDSRLSLLIRWRVPQSASHRKLLTMPTGLVLCVHCMVLSCMLAAAWVRQCTARFGWIVPKLLLALAIMLLLLRTFCAPCFVMRSAKAVLVLSLSMVVQRTHLCLGPTAVTALLYMWTAVQLVHRRWLSCASSYAQCGPCYVT